MVKPILTHTVSVAEAATGGGVLVAGAGVGEAAAFSCAGAGVVIAA